MPIFKKNYLCTLILAISTYSNFFAITINGQDINTIVKPGQTLAYEDSTANNIFLCVKDGNVEIGSLKLTNIQDVKAFFNALESNKDQLYNNISKDIVSVRSGAHISMEGAYISGDNKVILNASTNIKIVDAILKSKKIVFIGNNINAEACFIDTDLLHIESNRAGSLFEIICFTFDKNTDIPASIQGRIDFEKDETEGDFIVVGANKIEIVFAHHAFESNNK